MKKKERTSNNDVLFKEQLYSGWKVIWMSTAVYIGCFSLWIIWSHCDDYRTILSIWVWSMAQVIQSFVPSSSNRLAITSLEQSSWRHWETTCPKYNNDNNSNSKHVMIPIVDFRSTCIPSSSVTISSSRITLCPSSREEVTQEYMQRHLGRQWMEYPVFFRGIWGEEELASPSRRLSIDGLQRDDELSNVYVNYFTTASALKPNSKKNERVGDIVQKILSSDEPLKLASQLPLQQVPNVVSEVAPLKLVESLFGRNRFEPHNLLPTKLFFGFISIPAATSVPIFLASSNKNARTDLHAEPIGNFAVQLHGSKQWTLAFPEQTFCLRPTVSNHGRAYYYSQLPPHDQFFTSSDNTIQTHAGDALWIPPWTWHRVDYTTESTAINHTSISMAASLFHFRFYDFCYNHPLLAFLIIPNLIREAMGTNTE